MRISFVIVVSQIIVVLSVKEGDYNHKHSIPPNTVNNKLYTYVLHVVQSFIGNVWICLLRLSIKMRIFKLEEESMIFKGMYVGHVWRILELQKYSIQRE